MATYAYDHIHLRAREPEKVADFYCNVFDAKVVIATQPNGQARIELDLDGLVILIAGSPADDAAESPPNPYLGLDHFGLRVQNVDDTVAELTRRGAEIIAGPRTIRPGVRIAFVRAPDNVRIELLQRDPA